MMKKKNYEAPEAQLILFTTENVLATSADPTIVGGVDDPAENFGKVPLWK